MKRFLVGLIVSILFGGVPLASAGSYTANNYFWKPAYRESGPAAFNSYNAALDATDLFLKNLEPLPDLIANWVIEDQIVTMIPGTAAITYGDADTFTLTGNYTSRFPAGAVVQIHVAAGMVYSTVASSSYAAPTTTVNLSSAVLTDPITRGYVVATRDGLWPNGPGYVVARDYGTDRAALVAADAVAAGSGKELRITHAYTIDADVTLDSPKITVQPGVPFAISTTKTLTINGSLNAGLYKIFTCAGTGKVVFGAGAVKAYHPEWWVANATPGTTDMTAAILASYTAARDADKGVVRLLANQYAIADLVLPQCTNGDGVMIAGAGPNNTKLIPAAGHTAGNPLITLAGTHAAGTDGVYLRDFQIYGAGGDTNGLLIQPSNNCRIEDVTILSCSGIGFEAQRPYDLYTTRLRVYGCGKYADSEPGVLLRKDPLTNAWGNQVYWNQCNVEGNYYRQMEIKGIAGMDAHGGKIHGIPTTGTDPDKALGLLYIDGMAGWGRFHGVLFTHAHYANAVHISDSEGLAPGTEAYSMASFIGCDFTEISSYDAGVLSIDGIYFDAGDVESSLRVQGCRFGYHASGLGAAGRYIHISANAGVWDTNTGGNQFRDKTAANQVLDDRTSATRSSGFRAQAVTPDVLSLGTDQNPELTIASGAVTLTSSLHYIDTEADGATDDLVTVNGLTRRGTVVIIRAMHTNRTVVIKTTGGNIKCQGGADITLDSTDKAAVLINMNGTNWWAFGG